MALPVDNLTRAVNGHRTFGNGITLRGICLAFNRNPTLFNLRWTFSLPPRKGPSEFAKIIPKYVM